MLRKRGRAAWLTNSVHSWMWMPAQDYLDHHTPGLADVASPAGFTRVQHRALNLLCKCSGKFIHAQRKK